MNISQSDMPAPGADPRTLTCVYSIFQQPWWLDAVAPGQWDAVTIEENGRIVARWPFVIKRRYGLVILSQPDLTKTLGPWLIDDAPDHNRRLSRQKELLQALLERLPPHDLLHQGFCPEVTNWLPLYWHGFRQTTYYTYRIHDLTQTAKLYQEFDSKVRYSIRRAEKQLSVRHDLGIETMLQLVRKTFERKSVALSVSENAARRLVEACESHQAYRLFFAEDAQGHVHAGMLLVYDAYCAYYLLGGMTPENANSGAMSLLIWHAIQYAATVTKIFDFEGSMDEDIERFFRRFSSQQTPYYFISRMTRRLKWLNAIRRRLP